MPDHPPASPPPAHAALYFLSAGYTTARDDLMGIAAASEGVLRALVRHDGPMSCTALVDNGIEGEAFRRAVAGWDPARESGWIHMTQAARLAAFGTLLLPGPGLIGHAWARQRHGARAWSLCGITHTTATARVMDLLTGFSSAPIHPWDAVICTSRAARAMVTQMLDDQDAFLAERLGARPAPRPMLPLIPLGIFCDDVAATPDARAEWRTRLNLGPHDVAALFVGRFSHLTKASLVPLLQAAQLAAGKLTKKRRLALILAGWFSPEANEADYQTAVRTFCPDVAVTILDGRVADVRRDIWSAADLFVSPVDNIQETFGLTPVEAMAAGLPVVVSDWNGYRDTIEDGVEGFRVPTIAAPEGVCASLTDRFADASLDYAGYIGAVAQTAAVDIAGLAHAIHRLAENPALRQRMGMAGRQRAQAQFDWSVIIPAYQRLWREQAALRAAEPLRAPQPWPARPDPGRAFAAWPTLQLAWNDRVSGIAAPPASLATLLASPLVAYEGASLPRRRDLDGILQASLDRSLTVSELVGSGRPDTVMRAILWLAKYGLIEIVANR